MYALTDSSVGRNLASIHMEHRLWSIQMHQANNFMCGSKYNTLVYAAKVVKLERNEVSIQIRALNIIQFLKKTSQIFGTKFTGSDHDLQVLLRRYARFCILVFWADKGLSNWIYCWREVRSLMTWIDSMKFGSYFGANKVRHGHLDSNPFQGQITGKRSFKSLFLYLLHYINSRTAHFYARTSVPLMLLVLGRTTAAVAQLKMPVLLNSSLLQDEKQTLF